MNPRTTPARPGRAPRAAEAVTCAVLGVPVRFQADAAEVMEVVHEAFGAWRGVAPSEEWAGREPLRVRLRRVPGGQVPDPPAPVDVRLLAGRRLALRAPGVRGFADAERGTAVGRVSAGALRQRGHVRYSVVELLTNWLVTHRDREPIHAAAIVRGGTALLLGGRSGTGKSTLAYAAMRCGLSVLSEDCVFLQEAPVPRVWGLPGFVHLHPDAVRWFPELAGVDALVRNNGDLKLAVPAAAPAVGVERAGICLLARGPHPGVERLAPEEAERAFTVDLEPGFDLFAGSIGRRVRRLAEHGGWRLTLPPTPQDAVPALHRMLDEIERGRPRQRVE